MITQINIRHIIGLGNYTLQLFAENTYTEKVFEFVSDESNITLSSLNLEYQNSDSTPNSFIYAKMLVESGSGHKFQVKLFANKL
jgi:hypothetical protein